MAWLAERLPSITGQERPTAGPEGALSRREMEILNGLMRGCSNKQIANDLGITEGTVKVHLKRTLKKINARNRTQAAVWAMNQGLPLAPN